MRIFLVYFFLAAGRVYILNHCYFPLFSHTYMKNAHCIAFLRRHRRNQTPKNTCCQMLDDAGQEQRLSASQKMQNKPIAGSDTKGHHYASTNAMWKHELQGDLYDARKGWYGKSLEYWRSTPATLNGVLGGLPSVHDVDIKESAEFLSALPDHGTKRALDCGAGIGRISKNLLCKLYDVVDLLEPVEHMLEQAKKELDGLPVGDFILSSMEKASLPPQTYDLIVIQWTAIYLTDDDFVKFFRNCKQALTPNGYIFFKENCLASCTFLVDKDDSSLTRSDFHYKHLFEEAGVQVVKESFQKDWPRDLMPVKMYGLK